MTNSDSPEAPAKPEDLQAASADLQRLLEELQRAVVGQRTLLERMIVGLLCEGHLLLEGVPGLGKTLAARSLCRAVNGTFRRVQFTPDLLPADVIGHQVYRPHDGSFSIHRGPVFANLILADEVNRAPAKVQSALLEAMQERQVTIGNDCLRLPAPFMVLATQNPIELEGTYPLPEAELDRFMLKLLVEYPTFDEEGEIMDRVAGSAIPECSPVIDLDRLAELQKLRREIFVSKSVRDYAVSLVHATRRPEESGLKDLADSISYGASPRAGIAMLEGARAIALMEGRAHVLPDDVQRLAPDALRHRLILSFEAETRGVDAESLIRTLVGTVPVG